MQSEDVLSNNYTPFEYLLIESIKQAIEKTEIDITNKDTIIIVSTTKGNINLLKKEKKRSDELVNRISLSQSAQLICNKFKNPNKPIVISNACISGVAAILYGKRILDLGHYKNAIIVGADCVGQFIFLDLNHLERYLIQCVNHFQSTGTGLIWVKQLPQLYLQLKPKTIII